MEPFQCGTGARLKNHAWVGEWAEAVGLSCSGTGNLAARADNPAVQAPWQRNTGTACEIKAVKALGTDAWNVTSRHCNSRLSHVLVSMQEKSRGALQQPCGGLLATFGAAWRGNLAELLVAVQCR
eukprot:365165-Chlamydomonas_euryale.AAC.3